jgi:hypothetical protein
MVTIGLEEMMAQVRAADIEREVLKMRRRRQALEAAHCERLTLAARKT